MNHNKIWNLARQLILVVGLVVISGLAIAQDGDSNRLSGLKLSGDEPIQIESDQLEVRDNESKAIFTGNVNVVQGDMVLKAGRMTVFYAKSGNGTSTAGSSDIDRLEVDGKVYLRSADQVATGDRGTFDMTTEVLVLTGEKVVLTEGDNIIVGCKLTVQMKTGQARFRGCDKAETGSGRIIMQVTPRNEGG